jgi:hypothetical protein
MRPTVFFARADGTHRRLLYLFASAGKAYSASTSGNRRSLMKGGDPASVVKRMPCEEGWRSGTNNHRQPKTDIVVAVERIVDVAIDGARIDMIVEPRAAPQVRRREPHSLHCPRSIP